MIGNVVLVEFCLERCLNKEFKFAMEFSVFLNYWNLSTVQCIRMTTIALNKFWLENGWSSLCEVLVWFWWALNLVYYYSGGICKILLSQLDIKKIYLPRVTNPIIKIATTIFTFTLIFIPVSTTFTIIRWMYLIHNTYCIDESIKFYNNSNESISFIQKFFWRTYDGPMSAFG